MWDLIGRALGLALSGLIAGAAVGAVIGAIVGSFFVPPETFLDQVDVLARSLLGMPRLDRSRDFELLFGLVGGILGAVGVFIAVIWIDRTDDKDTVRHKRELQALASAIGCLCLILLGKGAWRHAVIGVAGALMSLGYYLMFHFDQQVVKGRDPDGRHTLRPKRKWQWLSIGVANGCFAILATGRFDCWVDWVVGVASAVGGVYCFAQFLARCFGAITDEDEPKANAKTDVAPKSP